jgi:outer membrane protein
MKKVYLLLVLLSVALSCNNNNKYAFVDRSVVINGYEAKLNIEERFKIKNEAFIKRRDSLIQQYEFDRKEASIKAQRMSQEELQKLGQEFQQREALLGQQIQFEQQELQKAFDAELDSVISQVKTFVKGYGEKNGYSFIFGTSDATNTVMYGPEGSDISQIILDELNANYSKSK